MQYGEMILREGDYTPDVIFKWERSEAFPGLLIAGPLWSRLRLVTNARLQQSLEWHDYLHLWTYTIVSTSTQW